MAELGNCLGRRRGAAGLRQLELARRVGISRQALSTIEAGRSVPSAALALRLARALGCKVEDLFWADDVTTPIEAELAGEARPARRGSRPRKASADAARVSLASIDGRWVAHRLDPASPAGFVTAADGILRGSGARAGSERVMLLGDEATARNTLLCAGCAPAFGILAARASRSAAGDRVVWLERTSGTALDLLAKGQIHVAGAHLYDEEAREFNVPFVQRRLPDRSMLVFNLARWEAGLVVAAGNPLRIRGVRDLIRPDVAFVRRQDGAAAQELVERLLRRAGIQPAAVARHELVAGGHAEVARLIALGAADAGVALATVARAHGLDFVPLVEERFDLVVSKALSADPRVMRLLETLSSRTFRREMESLGGHVTRDAGKLIAETHPAS
ncbi:MAG TPA: substrate-binding domain-containing protein [Polyangia bacterium]|jgi:molybdate-binding protein/DNA-binding XRE family transcriptional regulator